ncbi:gliding motility-associated C-terminal domain-containing protein [Flavobacterium resistens]|uniref:Gliding motility-associated C-terminal domain-containing protein n=1 Tax=Flavobacterium resistens TaxID=443612 RepID=A0A521CMI2_9FLAO|nr:gliding motility-associated C-terminal domain-containing protein [Flavobacterium resistens]SMO60636.1 gliding motility-associated C-terminal domain-containing protein [Flavobacterium resistens]
MRNSTSNQSRFSRLNLFIAFLFLISFSASAQFYTKHYIAPAPWQYFSKANEIVISTNSLTEVTITLTKSDGTFEATLKATKGAPAVYRFKLNATTLPMNPLNTVLNGVGLIITSTGPTAVNLRNVASDDYIRGENADAYIKGNAALTSFGDAGLGIRFRVGYYRDGSLGNFGGLGDQRPIYSVMATVDNTTVKIDNTITATLNAGQSYLFKAPIGTLVETSNPAVMNTAAGIDTPDGCGDGAYNQIPPEAVLGTEYFLVRGTGNDTAEQTTVVATKDDTNLTINGYSTTGALVSTINVNLPQAGKFYTFKNGVPNNGNSVTSFTSSRVFADKRVAVYSGTAQSCEVDISTIAPVSECGGSNFIETAKFKNYQEGTLDYFGYILLRSATEIVTVNGNNIANISGIGARYQIGTTGWYLINFNSVQIGSPDVLSIASNAKLTVSIVQQAGGFSMAGFFSNFAAQPDEPTLTYISGGGCTNNTAELTTPPNFAPYQWYYNGTAISGANSSTYTATKTGNYSVSSTLACGAQTQSKPVTVTLCTDLGITKTVDNATPCIGSNVEFTVKVTNLGGNNVSGVSVNDLLPSGYTYVSSTSSIGIYDSSIGTWSIGDVDAQTSVTLKITATVKATGNYTNTASLPASIDINTANNSASAAVNPKLSNLVITNPVAVCSPLTVDLTASAITAGSSSNLTLSYWTNSTATTSYSTPTAAVAGTYYIKAVSSDGCVFVKPVVVTVNALPTTPTINVNSGQASCGTSGGVVLRSTSSANTLGGSGSSYLWSTGENTRSITITTDGVYSLKIINSSGCVSNSSASITVTLTPATPTASNQTFCSSENKKVGDLVATGSNIKWYSANSGGTALSTNQNLPTTAGTYNYYASQTSANNCESTRTAIVVTINNTSSAPIASAQTFCAADNKKISDLSPSGPTIKWYDTNSSSSALAGTTVLTSKTYYVSQTANSCGESARTAVVVTINNVPGAPTALSQTFCVNDEKTVNDLAVTLNAGSTKKWYNASTAGTAYSGTELLTTRTYYVSQTNACGESTRTPVVVTVNTTSAPTASAQTFCAIDSKTVNDLAVTLASGASKKWYNASVGGTAYVGNEVLFSGTYYVSQILNSCESTRTAVAVTVNNTAAPIASSQTFCVIDNKTVNDLAVTLISGATKKWYSASSGGTLYNGTETLASANYYVSQTLNNCESSRILVAVTVNPTPATPSISAGGSTTFCTGGNVVLTSSSGIGYLWSNGATTQSITASNSGNYSVQVSNASGCYSASSTPVTVTVNTIPSAPTVSVADNCNGTSTLSTTATGTLLWSTGETTSSITVSIPGNYSVTQTVNGCTSASGSGTAAPKTAPSAPTVSVADNCNGTSTLSTTATGTLLWSTGETTSSITVSIPGNYSVTQTVNGCTSASGSGTAAPKTAPSAPTVSVADNCNGTSTLSTTATGTLLWSTGETTSSITVSIPGNYSVTQTVNGCTSASGSGTAAPKTAPSAPTASSQTFCAVDAKIVNDLVAVGSNLKWYNASTGGSLYLGTETLTDGIYYVSQTTNDCESNRTAVTVTITSKPAKVITTATICSGDIYKWSVNSVDYTVSGTYPIVNNGCTADQELHLTVINVASPIVGLITQPTCLSSTASVELSGLPTGSWTINPGNITGNTAATTITGLIGGNVYNYTVTDSLGCQSVPSANVAVSNYICAEDDTPSIINGAAGGTISTVFVNDKINGASFLSTDVTVSTSPLPTGIVFNSNGTITVAPNTFAGTYSITYTICMSANASVCDSATVDIVVERPVIDAVTETTTAINSNNGGTTISLTANDTLNGTPVTVGTGAGQVTFTLVSTLPTGLTLNADKTITVAPGTASGNYEVEYTICDNDHALNCDTVKSYIQVTGDVLVANTDNPTAVTQSATAQTIITVVDNDTRNGQPLTASEVKITTTVADPSGYLTLDPTTGVATLGANAPAGAYSLTYSICDKANASNCSTASVNLTVTAPVVIPVIDAVTETTTAINSNNGGTTISLTANDTLNGTPVTVGTGAGKVTFTLVSTLPAGLTINADKTITVASGTASGNYEVEYTICDNDHALNCDTVKSYIQVTGDLLVLKDDLVGPIAGVNHPMTVVNVLGNDTKNGLPITSSDVNLSVTIADPAGYLTLNPDGTIILKENAPAGTYGLTYQVCELNTTNCKTADVKVTVVLPTMTVTTNSYCSNNVPYVSYNVTPDNFTTNNLLTVKWIDSDNNVVATQTNLPLSGSILWPGAIVDSNGIGVDWPGWLFANGQWTEGADGFEKTRTGVTMEFSLNPTVSTIVSYPPATPQCNARPTFEIKANNDAAGPIDAKKGISTALNIFSNDRLNGTAVNQTAVVLTTVIPNSNLILNADGSVDVKTGTPSGTYQLTYQICEASNSSNCSQAVVNVTVVNSEDPAPAPQIITKDDLQVNVDGINGQLEFINVLDNDLVNGLPIDPANVVISNTPKSPYFEFNADGTVNVKPNTPGGSYSLVYQVCEKANSSNCSSSTLNVFVEVPNIAIIKTAVFNDENGNGFANAGETITYKFKVTNTGNVPLTNVSVSDPLPGVVVSGQTINLGVGESNDNNFTAKYKITQSDIISGTVSNQATAFGKSARGVEVEDKSDDESNSGDRPTVLSLDGCKIKVLNAFSPNGDSKNARFYIQGIECYPDNTVEIYNRWGVLVFDIDHYNNEDRVFVGVSAGRATIKESDGLPVGTYFYILKYKDSDSNQHEQSGYLYLNK